jgi:hypothetical protein
MTVKEFAKLSPTDKKKVEKQIGEDIKKQRQLLNATLTSIKKVVDNGTAEKTLQ